jgi:hypothetical protein
MFVGRFRMGVGFRRFLATLAVFTLAMMFSGHLMALRGVVVVLGCLGVGVFGHVVLLRSHDAMPLNAAKPAIVPHEVGRQ